MAVELKTRKNFERKEQLSRPNRANEGKGTVDSVAPDNKIAHCKGGVRERLELRHQPFGDTRNRAKVGQQRGERKVGHGEREVILGEMGIGSLTLPRATEQVEAASCSRKKKAI